MHNKYGIEASCLLQIISFLEYLPPLIVSSAFTTYLEVKILQQLNEFSFIFLQKRMIVVTIICENTITILKKGICLVHALRLF